MVTALMIELKKVTGKDYFVIGEISRWKTAEYDVIVTKSGETDNWTLELKKI